MLGYLRAFVTITWLNMADMTGASMDPILANIDAMDTALFLKTVGNSSAE